MVSLRKVASRSPAELRERVLQKVRAASERGLLLLGVDGVESAPRAAAGEAYRFVPACADWTGTVAALKRELPEVVADTLRRAERIERGELEILGLGWIALGTTPDWHFEPIARVRAPRVHWSRIAYLDPAVVGDHKILWEFNRHQHLVTLGQAWRLTGDERWATCAIRHVESWLEQNPPRIGVNWASSLEVAYRAISWCWMLSLFGDNTRVRDTVAGPMTRSLDQHAKHVARYLSTYFSPNTHLTGEALGLLYVGTTLPSLADSARYRRLGSRILREQLTVQLFPDGVYFEQASQYHRYTTEIYLHALLLEHALGGETSALRDGVGRLFDALHALTRSDGTIPLIGDDDGGRLVQLDHERPHEVRNLLATGAALLERPALACGARDATTWGMATWLLGAAALDHRAAAAANEAVPRSSRAFPDGGIYVMRDRCAAGHAVVDAGPHGALSCGHSHADALAVELWAGGGALFVDAGTLTYVGTERDAFRSTAAHNTVELDDVSASLPAEPFKWRTRADGVADGWCAQEAFVWFRGHHEGYRRLAVPATHARDVVHLLDGVWYIQDDVRSTGEHRVALRWLLSPTVQVGETRETEGIATFSIDRAGTHVATVVLAGGDGSRGGSVALEDATVSPQFGRAEATRRLIWRGWSRRDLRLRSIVIDWTVCGAGAVRLIRADGTSHELRAPDGPRGGRVDLAFDVAPRGIGAAGVPEQVACTAMTVDDGGAVLRALHVGFDRDAASPDGGPRERTARHWQVADRVDDDWIINSGVLSPAGR